MIILNPLGVAVEVDASIALNLKTLKALKCKTWDSEFAYNKYAKNNGLPIHAYRSTDALNTYFRIQVIGLQYYYSGVFASLVPFEAFCLATYIANFNPQDTAENDPALRVEEANRVLALLEADPYDY